MKQEEFLNNYTSPGLYQITLEGKFNTKGIQEMTGMSVSYSAEGNISTLTGILEDQGALNGLINTLYNQRLSLVSIIKISN